MPDKPRAPVRIALIDDHRMLLDGLTAVINSIDDGYECTGFVSPLAFLSEIENGRQFELTISDLIMDEMNGIALLQALQARNWQGPTLMISGVTTAPPIDKILAQGANGFVPKSADKATLAAAISVALEGEVYLPDELWNALDKLPRQEASGAPAALTETDLLGNRQIEILQLVAEGYSNKQVSAVLGITENTTKTHMKTIFRQLNATRRTECVKKARALGLID